MVRRLTRKNVVGLPLAQRNGTGTAIGTQLIRPDDTGDRGYFPFLPRLRAYIASSAFAIA